MPSPLALAGSCGSSLDQKTHSMGCPTTDCQDSRSASSSRLPSLSRNTRSSSWARLSFVSSPSPASTSSSPTSSSSSSAPPPLYSSNSASLSPGSTSVSSNPPPTAVSSEATEARRLRFSIGSLLLSDHTSQSSQTTCTPSPPACTSSKHGTRPPANTVFSQVPDLPLLGLVWEVGLVIWEEERGLRQSEGGHWHLKRLMQGSLLHLPLLPPCPPLLLLLLLLLPPPPLPLKM
ncbi:hypothetical protein J005_02578 [Cryptococcus neoformans]|nr:hypothetical protein J005_02578 [Cryptococcus neoformans var. grubii]